MPLSACPASSNAATAAPRYSRADQVAHLEALNRSGQSQRAYAHRHGLPSTTLRDWAQRRDAMATDPQLVDFFESPAGLALLHRLFVAALVVMNLQGTCGLRLVGQFFERAGLSELLACSYGTLQQHSYQLHRLVADFGQLQQEQLGASMPHKRIVVCEDETFPASGMTLVAMEPVSNFLLAEQVAQDRTASTWNALLDRALAPYNVEVVAQCSDEAAALRAHANDRGVPHGPDLFHVLHDVQRSLVLHLSQLQRAAAEAGDDEGVQQVSAWQEAREVAVMLVGDIYHPYNPWTGGLQTAEEVGQAMQTAFDDLAEVAWASGASASNHERLAKAWRVVPSMVGTVAGYHQRVLEALEALEWPQQVHDYVAEVALPAAYLRRVAASQPAAERDRLVQLSAQIARGRADSTLSLPAEEREQLTRTVQECAGWFCRSSSCVEGRNGVLSLRQHAHRRLTATKRAALTVAHNFLSLRPDGSTAANRFFEQTHPDLFEWLLQRMPDPPRPAASRAKQVSPPQPVA